MTLIMRLLARYLSGRLQWLCILLDSIPQARRLRPQFPCPDSLHSLGIPVVFPRDSLEMVCFIVRELYGNSTGIVREGLLISS